MKLKRIHYSAVMTIGNYNNERIGFTAELEEDDSIEDCIHKLREKARHNFLPHIDDLRSEIYERQRQLKELEKQIKNATETWNSTAEFLRAQGLKPEAPNMPQFTNLLPHKIEEETVIDPEILDDEESSDEF